MRFALNQYLKIHISFVHDKKKPFSCESEKIHTRLIRDDENENFRFFAMFALITIENHTVLS